MPSDPESEMSRRSHQARPVRIFLQADSARGKAADHPELSLVIEQIGIPVTDGLVARSVRSGGCRSPRFSAGEKVFHILIFYAHGGGVMFLRYYVPARGK